MSDWLLGYLDAQDAQAVYSGYAFHVLSHENGSSMHRMLTAVTGGPVPGLPDRAGMSDGTGTVLAGGAEVIATPGTGETENVQSRHSRFRRGIGHFWAV